MSEIYPGKPSQNLTGKPSLTYSIGPFIVELFTAERLTRSPKRSHSGTVCRQTAAPHASRVERTHSPKRDKSRTPRTGFGIGRSQNSAPALSPTPTNFVAIDEKPVINQLITHFTDTASRQKNRRKVFPHRPSSQSNQKTYWIERWYYFDQKSPKQTEHEIDRDLLQRASINTERTRLHVLSAKGQQKRKWLISSSYPRLMKSRFLSLLPPTNRRQHKAVMSSVFLRRGSDQCVEFKLTTSVNRRGSTDYR